MTVETETLRVRLVAHLHTSRDPIVDVYTTEAIYSADGRIRDSECTSWIETLHPDTSADLLDVDLTAAAAGYARTTAWRGPRITETGLRWDADATTQIEDIG